MLFQGEAVGCKERFVNKTEACKLIQKMVNRIDFEKSNLYENHSSLSKYQGEKRFIREHFVENILNALSNQE
jgi:hypothetical protein